MSLSVNDRIVYPSRCETSDVLAGLRRILGSVPDHAEEFLSELEAACFEGAVDFSFAASHAMNEANYLRDSDFQRDRNAFGIGHPDNAQGGIVFESFRAGARFYVGELLLKLRMPVPDSLRDARSYAPAKWDQVVTLTISRSMGFPRVDTIADLNKRFGPNNREAVWMTDPNGPAAIVAKGNALVNVPNQQTGGTVPGSTIGVPVTMIELPRSAANRPETKLPATGQLHIVVHETGNTNAGADAVSQIRYMQSAEAQSRRASYHLSVDDHQIIQGIPLDEIAWHAGDGCDNPAVDIGCFRSIAIETCVNRDGNKTQTRRNLAELIARLCAGDPAFDWGGGSSKGRFDIDHLLQHHDVSDEGKNCPMQIRDEGFWPTLMTWVDQAWAIWGSGTPPPPPGPTYAIPSIPDWWEPNKILEHPVNQTFENKVRFFAGRRKMTVRKATVQRATASAKGKACGKDLPAHTPLWVEGSFRNGSGKWVMCSGNDATGVAEGARVAMKDLTENISVSERA